LKKVIVSSNGSFFKGGFGFKKVLAVALALILIFSAFIPIITSADDPPEITIINVQSYPVVGGRWTVEFNTVGTANLIISAVNGTTWSDTSEDYDLKFLNLKTGNETIDYGWIDDSVVVANYSSNETGYERSLVLTPGKHTLKFQFGDDVAYANNLAGEYWNQTTTSDFNNGTNTSINVSGGAFYLEDGNYSVNTSLIDDESFEGGTWPPAGWTATGVWDNESDAVYDGLLSADFDGDNAGGGLAGNLNTSPMDCSDTYNITAIYIDFYARADLADDGDYYLDYYNGTSWVPIRTMHDFGVGAYAQYTDKITNSSYFVSNFSIRWRVVQLKNSEKAYVDLVNVTLEKNTSGGYASAGSLISEAHNTSRAIPDYTGITVSNNTPASTTITTWVRAADTQGNLASATWYTDISSVPSEQWVQWRVNLTSNQLVTPTVYDVNLTWNYDDEAPVSSVDDPTPYWQNTTPFTVDVTASDIGSSGISEVALYYNYSNDNSSWGTWTLFGTNDTDSPYSWSFTAPAGDGYYRFYSIAVDNESNTEAAPGTFDNQTGVDTTDPSSSVDDIVPYTLNQNDNPLLINVTTASDTTSGVKSVTLYYANSTDNSTWSSYSSWGTDTEAPWQWSFTFEEGNQYYKFYSIAADNASNYESAPVTPDNDTDCNYTSTLPISSVDEISPYWQNTSPLVLTGQATDNGGSGLDYVHLYFYNSTDNSTWTGPTYFANDTDPWVSISWGFNFPNGTGYYRFYSYAVDNLSNTELLSGNDTDCGYDNVKPTSSLDAIASYWQNTSPLTITATTVSDTGYSGVKNVTLYYYNSTDNSTWDGPWSFGIDSASPWSWSFNFPNGSGYYRFYSITADNASNVEDFTVNDTECGFDNVDPSSQLDPITPYWKGDPDNPMSIVITAVAPSDATSGIKEISLYYNYRVDNTSGWGSWSLYGTDTASPWSWSFNFPSGNGHYKFYSIALDNASNYESAPVSPDNDTMCAFTGPNVTGYLFSESNAVSSGNLVLTDTANADGSGTGTYANAYGGWTSPSMEYWDFTIKNQTDDKMGRIFNVTLYIKHNQSGWVNDEFKIQIYNGATWIDVHTYDNGVSNPPASDTLNSWDVQALGIDRWSEINDAIVRITGTVKDGNEDEVRWYVDTVEIRVDSEYPLVPTINSYDLRNATGSKIDNANGLLDVNSEYYFILNITDGNGWADIEWINITAWYDFGNEGTTYNQTAGGNINMFLQYENTTGTANFNMLWPDDEVTLVSGNCSETIINSTTRHINISFQPLSQVRWASSNDTWSATANTFDDVYSWNFNITVRDWVGNNSWNRGEYGVYKYTSVLPDSDWIDVLAYPGGSDLTNVVTITYSSNYDYNMSIYFEEDLTSQGATVYTIPIANNVEILAATDSNDDITSNKFFQGIGEANAIDIFNVSGTFSNDNASQTVDVQFNVYIPIAQNQGDYRARVATKIVHD
jgi:hypothetical protein